MKAKKILIVVDSIDVNDSSGAKVNFALIKNLHREGFELKVLHYSNKIIGINGISVQLIPENRKSLLFLIGRFFRLFDRIFKSKTGRFFESIFGFSLIYFNDIASYKKVLSKENILNYDLIVTLSKGGSFRPHYAVWKTKKLHAKWLTYIHDPYPTHFYPRPYNWVDIGYKKKEDFFKSMFEVAYKVGFPSLLLSEWMSSYFESIRKKSIIIPHQIDETEILTDLPDFFKQSKFNIVHAGNLLKQRNPKDIIEPFLSFLQNNQYAQKDCILYMIGHNSYHKEYLNLYDKHPNIIIQPYLDYRIVQNIECHASVNIILEADAEISPFLPGKFPNLVNADKPILLLSPFYSESYRLLGKEYPYRAEVKDYYKTEKLIQCLYSKWSLQEDNTLGREDLIYYLSSEYLKSIISFI